MGTGRTYEGKKYWNDILLGTMLLAGRAGEGVNYYYRQLLQQVQVMQRTSIFNPPCLSPPHAPTKISHPPEGVGRSFLHAVGSQVHRSQLQLSPSVPPMTATEA